MKYFSHLNTAVAILQEYKGQQPFDSFIKEFFSRNKKYGSKDRKNISQLCYSFFRLGKALQSLSVEDRVLTGLLLCSGKQNELLQQLRPEWNVTTPFSTHEIFPWTEELSNGINYDAFSASFLTQPDLFLRLRPGKENIVKNKLGEAGIQYKTFGASCLALDNSTKVNQLIHLNEEAVIQDYSSQRIADFLGIAVEERKIQKVWDCCAGSGGKSILANDLIADIALDLTVSDIRPSILSNLATRFAEAGIKKYSSFVADLTSASFKIPPKAEFDIIIADIPCSGSGTWSRTPEQLYYFDLAALEKFSNLQRKIVQKVIPGLKKGGRFLYITCSVFKEENEEIVQFISDNCHLTLIKQEVLAGYEHKADTMYAALFTA